VEPRKSQYNLSRPTQTFICFSIFVNPFESLGRAIRRQFAASSLQRPRGGDLSPTGPGENVRRFRSALLEFSCTINVLIDSKGLFATGAARNFDITTGIILIDSSWGVEARGRWPVSFGALGGEARGPARTSGGPLERQCC
jgi:hypothetical protein